MPTVAELNQSRALVRFTAYGELSGPELAALFPLVGTHIKLARGAYVQREGEPATSVHLLLEGWTASSMSTSEGKRQLLKVHVAGDLIGLPGLPYRSSPDSVVALTPIVVAEIDLEALGNLFRQSPRLAAVLFMISQEERLMLMERLFVVGAANTLSRLTGLVLQLRSRLLRRMPDLGEFMEFPLTQHDLADLLGVTATHVNRSLRELEHRQIMTWSRRGVELHDLAAMRELAGLPERTLQVSIPWLPETL